MNDRGKAVETYKKDYWFADYSSSSSDFSCRKHPSSSSIGICAYCLKDRLVKLVCSDCGEQRLSSCSCSDGISSNRNSGNSIDSVNSHNSGPVDVGSVGRISFLIENEKGEILQSNSKLKELEKSEVLVLKRSSSSSVEIKKRGIWKIGRFFRKKKENGSVPIGAMDVKSEIWVGDEMGVSRSRSLCSFRGGGLFGLYGSEDGGEYLPVSAARSSLSAARSSISAARSSGVNGGLIFEADRKSGFSETDPRKSGFSETEPRKSGFEFESETNQDGNYPNRRVFSLKESDFNGVDTGSGFIDLKFDISSSSDTKTEYSAFRRGTGISDSISAFGSMRCGNTIGIKRSRRSFKGWRWMFRQHSSSRKKVEDLVFSHCHRETVKT